MANELSKTEKQLLTSIEEKGIGNLIRPLVNEIFLFDTFVAETSNVSELSILYKIKQEDELLLKREEARYDNNAIAEYDSENHKLGYVPEKDNIVFARLMDAGKRLKAKVKTVKDLGYTTKITISIYLVDY